MFNFQYIIFILLIFLAVEGWSQQRSMGKPFVQNYSFFEYQAGLQNWAIVQDHRDIIYVGNRFGVLEYDGIDWNLIQLEKKTIGRSLAVDDQGTIYVGGQGEFGYLAPDSIGRLVYVPLWHELPKDVRSFEDVWRIHILPEAVAFSTVKALFIYSDEGFTVIHPTEKDHLFDRAYYCQGRLFVQEIGKGLLEWKDGKLELIPGGERFETTVVKEILPHPEQGHLILTFSEGIFSFDKNGIKAWEVPASQYAQENLIYSAIQLDNGDYAVGTSEQGLLLFEASGKILQTLNIFDDLQNNTVLSLWQDGTGNLWLGLDNGVSYVETNSPFTQLSGNLQLQGTPYTSIVWQGQLFLGTTNGVFQSPWDDLANPLNHSNFQLLEHTKGQAYQLSVVDDQLLLGHHQGAFVIQDQLATPISDTEGAWTFLELKQHPGFMIGGTYTGIELFRKEASGWTFVKHYPSFSESSRMMEQDSLGDIWIAHGNKGVFRLRLAEDLSHIENIRHYTSEDGFPSDIFINVHHVLESLIFTAEEGCYTYDAQQDSFVPHHELNNIFGPSAYVRELVEDSLNNIWYQVDDEFGVLKITDSGLTKQIHRQRIDKLKGTLLAGYEHIRPYAANGVLIGTQVGFVNFDPSHFPEQRPSFHTLIRDVQVIGSPDDHIFAGTCQQEGSNTQNQAENRRYDIPAKKNSLRFKYAAPFFEGVDKITYSYKLEGYEETWSAWTASTQREYTNISEGDYIFWVKARNIYQQESEPGAFHFSVLQPWYKTRLAITMYSLFFAGLIIVVFFANSRRLKNKTRQVKIEQAQALKVKEEAFFEQRAKSEQEIMRLTNEKLESEIAFKTRELTSSAIHLVQKGEILRKIKLDLEKLMPDTSGVGKGKISKIIKAINDDMNLDQNWEKFEYHFDAVHENFLKRLRDHYPNLSPKDQRLCAYLRMNLSTKEIAPLMSISVRGVEISRYRLRKKLNLESGTNLVEYLLQIN